MPGDGRDLSALDAVGSTGSPLSPEGFCWVYQELGADTYVYGRTDIEGESTSIIARLGGSDVPEVGSTVMLAADDKRLHLFDERSGERINEPAVGDPVAARALSAQGT